MSISILTADGHPAPPSWFVAKLEAFDPNLRVTWGFGLARPFPGWVIERRIPNEMKARVYGNPSRPGNRERFAHQRIVERNGTVVAERAFDMMPDWHLVCRIATDDGTPILELGEWVIDGLRREYERTLLGFPELARRYVAEDDRQHDAQMAKLNEQLVEEVADAVEDRKFEIFKDTMAIVGQPTAIKEGTELT